MKSKLISIMILIMLSIVSFACSNVPVRKVVYKPEISTKPTDNTIKTYQIVGDYYKLVKGANNYTINLYNRKKKLVSQETLPKMPTEPAVNKIDRNVIQVSIILGNPDTYVYFFNIDTGKISDVYYNPRLIENGKVVYVKDGKLIITDMFDRKVLYKEVKINFSPAGEPSHAIYEAHFIKSNKLLIKYFEGDAWKERSKIINLSN